MSVYKMNVDPESSCATCLSQGRKMFPVKFIKPFSITYKDLALTEKDHICWECNHFILKMTAFRSKVKRAQACLTAHSNRRSTQLQSLSKLSNSTVMYLEITPSQDSIKTEPLFVNVAKSEIDSDPEASNVCDENIEVFEQASNVCDEHFEVFKHETRASDKKRSSDINKHFEVFNNETRASDEKRSRDINEKGESIANATLLTLLTRTSIQPSFPKRKITIQVPPKIVLRTEEIGTRSTFENPPKIVLQTDKEGTESTSENPQDKVLQTLENLDVFTEERLTEEEMLKWWEDKKNLEFYLKSIPVFRCEKCVEPFCTRRSFLAHMERHTATHGDLACGVCDLKFMTEAALETHKANHYRILKCAYCPHKWDNCNSMRLHCSTAHGARVAAWTCELCPREFPSLYKYLCHARSHRYQECETCGKRVSPGHVRQHKLSHERGPERPYACGKCDRKFLLEAYLKRHMQVHVTEVDEGAYCAECNKQFRDMYQYNQHMKYAAKHASPEIFRYKCEECGRGFAQKVLLRRHAGKHSDLRNYPCGACAASFKSTQARKRHQREKHEGYVAPRKYMCDYCGKAFAEKLFLSQHINTHTGARPYACVCGAAFGFKSALYLHRRFKHKVQKKSTKDNK